MIVDAFNTRDYELSLGIIDENEASGGDGQSGRELDFEMVDATEVDCAPVLAVAEQICPDCTPVVMYAPLSFSPIGRDC